MCTGGNANRRGDVPAGVLPGINPCKIHIFHYLKVHGIEADFLGFLQKLVTHRSVTLPFELFRFWLWIRGDIHKQKTNWRLAESESRFLNV
jgi:hypothetical protein